MIAKAKSCPGGTALFQYVVNENKGYELFRNGLSGITPKELYSDMSIFQQQNLRGTNNSISMILSPSIEDSSKMTDDQLKTLTEGVLMKMNLNPKLNQFIAFVHTEKDHKHVHVIMNRVNTDGTLIKDNHISKKAQRAAHETAVKYGWTSAKELKEIKELKLVNSNKEIKQVIKSAHYSVLKKKPENLEVYQKGMDRLGIEVLPTINKQGNIQGFRFIYKKTGINLKASEVDRKMRLQKLFTNKAPMKTENISKNISLSQLSLNVSFFNSISSLLNFETGENQDKNNKRKRRSNGNSRNL